MKQYDPKTWARKHHYAFFRDQSHPYFGLTSRVELGALHRVRASKIGTPFSLFLFALCQAANQVPQLRQRIRLDGAAETVVEHDQVHPAFVVQAADDLFNFTTVSMTEKLARFCDAVGEASAARKEDPALAPFDGIRDDVLYCSCLPWIDFSHISHPIDTKIADSVPRFAWGQFQDDNTVSVNVQVHHALVDGRHIDAFFEALQESLHALPSWI